VGCKDDAFKRLIDEPGDAMSGPAWLDSVRLTLLVCLVFALPEALGAEIFTGRASAVPDGDTLWVQAETGGAARKLRLQGIDAPEICQKGGLEAREALQRLVAKSRLQVVVRSYDDYGRGLARIHVGNQDLGAAMVRSGHAWSYRWRRSPGPYAREESAARQARVGLFADATPELPGDFRKRHGTCHKPK